MLRHVFFLAGLVFVTAVSAQSLVLQESDVRGFPPAIDGFTQYGSSFSYSAEGDGGSSRYLITQTSAGDTGYGIWRPAIVNPGNYTIFAFIPSYATATAARYRINTAGGVSDEYINIDQSASRGNWVQLGNRSYYFPAYAGKYDQVSQFQTDYVKLGDWSQVPGQVVAFDAVMFVPEQGTLPVPPTAQPSPLPQANYAPELKCASGFSVKKFTLNGTSAGTQMATEVVQTLAANVSEQNVFYSFTCELVASEAAAFAFRFNSDDGIKLQIDDKIVVDQMVDRGLSPQPQVATVSLDQGSHTLNMVYYNRAGAGAYFLDWYVQYKIECFGLDEVALPEKPTPVFDLDFIKYTSVNGEKGIELSREEASTIAFKEVNQANRGLLLAYEGQIFVDADGWYAFRLGAMGDTRLYIDGAHVGTAASMRGPGFSELKTKLTEGVHQLRIEVKPLGSCTFVSYEFMGETEGCGQITAGARTSTMSALGLALAGLFCALVIVRRRQNCL